MNRTALAALVVGLTAVFFVTHCSSSPGSAPRTDAGSPDRLGGSEPESGIETGPRTDAGGGRDTGTEGGSGDAGLQTSNCFPSPGACGYPDPKYANVGPSKACSSLTPSGSLTVSKAGTTIEDLDVTGSITVTAANVTIRNVCVSTNGEGNINNGAAVRFSAPGGHAI